MIIIGLILIILGVCIQAFSKEKKLGKGFWIAGVIIAALGIFLYIALAGYVASVLTATI